MTLLEEQNKKCITLSDGKSYNLTHMNLLPQAFLKTAERLKVKGLAEAPQTIKQE